MSFAKVFKFQENKFKIVQKNFLEIIIKISWKTHWSRSSLQDKYGRSKAEDWWYLTVDQPLFAALGKRKSFYRQRIAESSCMRKETVDI